MYLQSQDFLKEKTKTNYFHAVKRQSIKRRHATIVAVVVTAKTSLVLQGRESKIQCLVGYQQIRQGHLQLLIFQNQYPIGQLIKAYKHSKVTKQNQDYKVTKDIVKR